MLMLCLFVVVQKEITAKSSDLASGKKEKKSGAKTEQQEKYTKIIGEFIENLLRTEVEVDDEEPVGGGGGGGGGGGRDDTTSGFDVDKFKEKFSEGDV